MSGPLTIEKIIEKFCAYANSDIKSVVPFIQRLFKNHLPDQNLDHEKIKEIIIGELKVLINAIDERYADIKMKYKFARKCSVSEMGNALVTGKDGIDSKNGFWMALHWITAKWFQDAKSLDDVPDWYLRLAMAIPADADRGGKLARDVISEILRVM